MKHFTFFLHFNLICVNRHFPQTQQQDQSVSLFYIKIIKATSEAILWSTNQEQMREAPRYT